MVKNVLLFFVFSLLWSIANAETLFFKKTAQLITPEEHVILYQIMLETQFPMSLMYGSYADDEIKVMNEKIKSKLPNSGIEATFIPTTLYELFVLNYIHENFNNGHFVEPINHFMGFNQRKNEITCQSIVHLAIQDFKDFNVNPHLKRWHLEVNNYINKFSAFPISFDQALKTVDLLFSKNFLAWANQNLHHILGSHPSFPRDMKRAIAIEFNAHATYQFALYRGSNFIDDYHDQKQSTNINRSISFGSGLLSGIVCDYSACPYYYISVFGRYRKYGYVLFIDKKSYAYGPLDNMFAIPPLTTLASLIAGGEFFHPRSKVINMENVTGFVLTSKERNDKQVSSYYQIKANTPQEAEKIYDQMLVYIKNHHLIFREQKASL